MNIIKNKTYNSNYKLSRYNSFPYYYNILDDKYIRGTTAYLKDDTQYTLHKVGRGDTFDNLALKYYNNPTYYWIICSFNHIQDPFETPLEGTTLKIPSMALIEFE